MIVILLGNIIDPSLKENKPKPCADMIRCFVCHAMKLLEWTFQSKTYWA